MNLQRKRSLFSFSIVAALGIACVLGGFPSSASADGDPTAGASLYKAYCQGCHGARGGIARLAANDPSSIVHETFRSSPYPRPLSGGELTDIAAYLGTLEATLTPHQGLWWVPNGAEEFWGVNLAQRGERIFATWYTYDTDGHPWWLSMLAERSPVVGADYAGPVYANRGPRFDAYAGKAVPSLVGTGSLTFSDADHGTFAYRIDTGGKPVVQSKPLERYALDSTRAATTCGYAGAAPNFAAAANYQDLWWVEGAAEDGWGINFAHQDPLLFATWYTYGVDGSPLWLSVLAQRVGTSNVYNGTLYRTSGPRYDAYDAAMAVPEQVGTATFAFADGNHASFDYRTNGLGGLPVVAQTKAITRFPSSGADAVVCR